MKTLKRVLSIVVLLATTCTSHAATNDLTSLLQQGLFEEEANRNLDAAIASYQSLATQFDKDRQIAATAVFRLGEVYRKLGKTNEAVVQYQRILRDFSDQQTLATLSRQNLTGLGAAAPRTSSAANGGATLDNLQSQYALLKSQLEQARNETNLDVVASLFDDSLLRDRLRLLEQARGILKSYQAKPESPGTLQSAEANLRSSEDFVEAARKRLFDLQELRLNILQSAIQQAGAGQSAQMAGSRQNEATPVTDDEEKEIRRIQQLIQNSPDLINAPRGGVNGDLTPLVSAALQGYLRVAQYLLDHGADVNFRFNKGTPLHSAVLSGNKAMVELLLSRGADINAKDGGGDTPLHTAVRNGFRAVAETLLDHKADANARNSESNGEQTPLHLAASRGNVDLTGLLLSKGADVNVKDRGGNTPLHSATYSGQTATIKALLDAKADINARNVEGETPLLVAAKYGKSDTAMALLAAGADPKLATTAQSWMNISPLHWAVAAGDEKLTQALLERGADPNLSASPRPTITSSSSGANASGSGTALMTACEQNKPALVNILLENGADPNVRYGDSTPLVVNMRANPEILRLLLEHKANPDAADIHEMTALHWLAMSDTAPTNAVALLLGNSTNVNAQDKNGNTPLLFAAEYDHPEVAATLLAFKADPNIRNKNGQTPLDFAKRPRQPAPGGLRIPVPLAPGTAVPVSSSAPTLVIDLATLLREHGALDNLPHLDRIELTRPSANFSTEAFSKGPNDWNRFTLLEAVAQLYGFINVQKAGESSPKTVSRDAVGWRNVGLGFPDFKAVVIHRPSADGKSWKNIPVDVGAILGSGDCSRDVWLQWGDVVEIPEADHPVSERWAGFAEPELNTLIKCVSRTITISINNTNVAFQLAPVFVVPQRGTPMDFYGEFLSPVEAGRRLVSFMVRSVLDQSKLIRFSSDLSRVKVTRRDAATGKTQSWVLDCSGGNLPDLWLRDGDVIEVPEK